MDEINDIGVEANPDLSWHYIDFLYTDTQDAYGPSWIWQGCEFVHSVPFEEGINYFEKYIYNTGTQELLISAIMENGTDVSADVAFFVEDEYVLYEQWLAGGDASSNGDVFGFATEYFNNHQSSPVPFSDVLVSANVYNTDNVMEQILWFVRINNPDYVETIEPILLGDANDDGSVNVSDIVLLVQHILVQPTLSTQGIANADINGDGALNVMDVVLTVNIILGTYDYGE